MALQGHLGKYHIPASTVEIRPRSERSCRLVNLAPDGKSGILFTACGAPAVPGRAAHPLGALKLQPEEGQRGRAPRGCLQDSSLRADNGRGLPPRDAELCRWESSPLSPLAFEVFSCRGAVSHVPCKKPCATQAGWISAVLKGSWGGRATLLAVGRSRWLETMRNGVWELPPGCLRKGKGKEKKKRGIRRFLDT